MLVFTRKRGEAIVIGDGIEIVVVGAGRDVRIGVRAPQHVPVHRKEIYELICEENRKAAGALAGEWRDQGNAQAPAAAHGGGEEPPSR
jgi:carbon storage regulator